MILKFIDKLGKVALSFMTTLGDFVIFLFISLKTMFSTPLKVKQLFIQMESIGVGGFPIVVLTGFGTGLVLALQTYIGFKKFGTEDLIGVVVSMGMARELGPILTGLMVTGRSGSAMSAELGTMRITEQVDALKTLCIDPYQYLIVPRLLASTIILPFLTMFSVVFGILGGYIYCVYQLDINPEDYMSGIRQYLEMADIINGLIKSCVFGLILSWVGTYCGYKTTKGGARAVGISTTQSVVVGSVLILIADYFLSAILFNTGVS